MTQRSKMFSILLLCGFGISTLVVSGAPECFHGGLTWKTKNGNLLVNEKVFHLKGISFFGGETETFAPHGLWQVSLSDLLDFVKDNNFNAIRLALSVEMVLENPSAKSVSCDKNPTICGLKALDLYGHVIDECAKRGILVMIDQHRLSHNGGITDLWYLDPEYTEVKVLQSWDIIMERFAGKWNVFALDLKNEPHGMASWGKNNRATDWNLAAQRIIKHIADIHSSYKGLFFVEGVQSNVNPVPQHGFAHFWGGNMEGVRRHPITTGVASIDERIVYSPHVYGPDVSRQDYFEVADFPDNMPHIWQLHFGFVETQTGHAVVVGEWGGHYRSGSADRRWADTLANYFVRNCMSDQFYWCLNPNSGDTGGVLNDDWVTARMDKLALLHKVQPSPSRLSKQNGQICFTAGAPANPECSGGSLGETTTRSEETTPPSIATTTGGGHGSTQLTVTAVKIESWQENGQTVTHFVIKMTNNGDSTISGIQLRAVFPERIKQKWNVDIADGDLWTFPDWQHVAPGQTVDHSGVIFYGSVLPSFTVLSVLSL